VSVGIIFFQASGVTLALFPDQELAKGLGPAETCRAQTSPASGWPTTSANTTWHKKQ
jgi:hypothetical protein